MAGGAGRRMGGALPKQFMMLGNMPILARTINTLHEALPAAQIVVVLPREHIELWHNLASRFDVAPHGVTAGGEERFHSVRNGLAALGTEVRYVMVHDAVRPLLTKKLAVRLMLEIERCDAVIPVVAPADSCRMVDVDGSHIVDRSRLRMVQTPQVFRAEALRKAYEQPFSPAFTDDASVAEAAGYAIALCEGERENIKITTPADLVFAEAIISHDENDSQL